MYFITGWKQGTDMFHFGSYPFGKFQLVRRLLGADGQIDGIQAVDTVDWGVRKGKHNIAKNNLLVTETSAKQKELTVEEDVIMTVGDFNIQQALIGSAEEAVDLAETAYSETKQRFMIGKADINSLTLSLNRQQEAQRNYISALQNYWLSYYKIRKLTLHDFETGVSLSNEFEYKYGL